MFVKFILRVSPKFTLLPSMSLILLEAASFQKRKGKGSESGGEVKLCGEGEPGGVEGEDGVVGVYCMREEK